MLRLFGYGAILIVLSLVLAVATGFEWLRVLTIICALAVIVLYLFLRRSLPQSGGTLTIMGLREPVEIYRDDRGIPHIYARNLSDLYLAQGYATAQDRLWQLEVNRRAAAGRLAEILGERFVPRDVHLRTVGLRRVAEASLALYSPAALAHLEAYAAGINAFIQENRLPPEFTLLRVRPDPWTPADSLAVAKLLAYELSHNWADQLFRAHLVQAMGEAKAVSLFSQTPDPSQLSAVQEGPLPDLDHLFALASTSLDTVLGSNGWVVSGARSRSGLPVLGSDLHAAARTPSAWHQAHLIGPDRLDVTGVTLPGMPGIVLGHTRDFAWSLSNLNADTQDLVIERQDPANPDRFATPDGWEPATVIHDQIRVRGGSPVPLTIRITRHGPVLSTGEGRALALRSTVLEPSVEIECLLQMNRARAFTEFRHALEGFSAPAQTALFAGRDGTIACLVIGRVPIRAQGDGQLPAPGWSGGHEWTGYVPPATLPVEVNPPGGFLVAANQNMTPPDFPHALGTPWAPPYRAQRLAERLEASADWTRAKGEQLQADTINPHARQMMPLLLAALNEGLRQGPQPEGVSDLERRALLLVTGWDHDEAPGSAATLLWHQWYLFLIEGIFRPQMGLTLFDQFVATRSAQHLADRTIVQAAMGEAGPWLGTEGEHGLPRIALRAFRRAVALLAAKYGTRPEGWRWGDEHQVRFVHPLGRRFRVLAHFLDLGPHPAPGSQSTVAQNAYSLLDPFAVSHAAPYRRVIDLAAPEEAVDISAPGASGHPLSPFFTDQFAAWQAGDYRPQPLRHSDIRRFPRLMLNPHP